MHTLRIKNLNVKIDDKVILDDFSLEIKSGEIHTIMGPNGTGKSTLSKVIMGDSSYTIVSGDIFFDDVRINDLTTDARAKLGLFLGMQMPPEIEGVTNADFLRTVLHSKEGESFKLYPFIKKLDSATEKLKMDKNMIHRSINKGFSGGERKKNEILQMYMLEPKVVLLDEIDSGLDIDSLKLVGEQVMSYYQENKPAILVITHYQRLLDYIQTDFVHVMMNGRIVLSGDKTVVNEIEKLGYEKIIEPKNYLSIGTCAIKENFKHE
jgi:Fe-S cluster assembly ATP-binding protein